MINTKLFERKIRYSDLNKSEVAKRAKISSVTLYKIIKGSMLPNVITAIKLSDILKFDIKEMWRE